MLTGLPSIWPPEWRDLFEERAAMMEFHGGLSRSQAEAEAARLLRREEARRQNDKRRVHGDIAKTGDVA